MPEACEHAYGSRVVWLSHYIDDETPPEFIGGPSLVSSRYCLKCKGLFLEETDQIEAYEPPPVVSLFNGQPAV